MNRVAVRAIVVLAVVVAVPACGGSGGGGGASVVASDDFSVFPGTAWTLNSGSPSQDGGNGNPAPCVACNTGPVDETAESVATHSTAGGVSISCHVALIGSGPGKARFKVSDDAVVGCEASAEVDGAAGTIDYSIGATTSTIATVNDGAFHSFLFSVDSFGVARWFRDGVLIMTQAGFPAGSLRIKLRGSGGGASPTTTALFDNVLVTRP